jgi:protein-S-isoprenylcysteine O-methyltransferase Ste14
MKDLNKKAFGGLLFLVIAMAILLFLTSWTLNYWQAWIFLAIFGGSSLLITLYLMKNDPKLLARRVEAGPTAEKEKSQKIIQSILSVGFIALLVVPGLDHHFHWTAISVQLVIVGDFLVAFGFLIIFFVFKQNTFTSAIIEVDKSQEVISTGFYSFIRHPMYMGAVILFIGMPLSLGSWWGFIVYPLMAPGLISRILNEENFLVKNLKGYSKYKKKVKYRLVPHVW